MNEFYYEMRVTTSDFFDVIENFLGEWCEAVIEENGAFITTYEYNPDHIKEALEAYKKQLEELFATSFTLTIAIQKKANIDWIETYKKSIEPITVGNYYIRAPWHPQKEGIRNFCIEPSLAFGTGHHPTTKNAMLFIQKYAKDAQTLLDVGCGSGILALTATDMGVKADICDSDENAISVAKNVFESNTLRFANAWVGSAGEAKMKYDIVVANIITDVLIMLSKDLKTALKKDGILILSGILDENEAKLRPFYEDLHEIDRVSESEWVTLVYRK